MFLAIIIILSIIFIVFILPFIILFELLTKRFSPVIRALLSLCCHIVALILGCFTLNFLGAVIQEYASNEILALTVKDVVIFLPYVIVLWVLLWGPYEAIRYFLVDQVQRHVNDVKKSQK